MQRSLLAASLAALSLTACLSDGKAPATSAPGTPPVPVRLIAINDFHGTLETPGSKLSVPDPADPSKTASVSAGGVDYLSAAIKASRAQVANSIVVSAGDLIGASPLISGLFHDEPAVEAMNALGLDINAVGNHEFDDGQEELLRMQNGGCKAGSTDTSCKRTGRFDGAKFKFLAANVEKADGKPIFPAYEIRKFGGIPVAVIGMTLKGTPEVVTPDGIKGLSFKDEAATVNKLVPELKKQGVEAIVVVVHEGGLQTGTYDECKGISGAIVDIVKGFDKAVDMVVSGHTHQAYNCVIDGRRVTSARNYGQMFTEIDFKLDPKTRDVQPASVKAVNRPVLTTGQPDSVLTQLVDAWRALVAPIANRLSGSLAGPLTRIPSAAGETTMGAVIADAMLASTLGNGAEAAFMNPGGVRAELTPEAGGNVTYSQIFTVQPFANTLMTLTLTGAQLDELLELQWADPTRTRILPVSTGFAYAYSKSAPYGQKVDMASITLNGTSIDAAKSYRVTVNSFMASGGDGLTVLPKGTNRTGGKVDIDALEDYLKANPKLAVPVLNRITALP
ncbi:bifunctional metallophosphatase/5'-nucleotidase [Crenobacter cavernae]|uniref:Bifunctional metallophosphatase/5'-nucleotidase n=1 Tax=Crenobacter cavernae TaxID=2290923 RepID=A0A345Y4P9_9NEIS|nr:bifunctional metallophosphatase/5'-nucleotidase [Crenobacter cavernae]AXK38901.1 bifunctional metallophosphatase/5'-nucleotidase [Crenobacter cavernae]